MTDWRNRKIKQPPRDGRPFWAYLYNSGIRKMKWETAEEYVDRTGKVEEPEEFEGAYVEADLPDNEWVPDWWTDYDAISEPAHD